MKLTLITVCFRAEGMIAKTVESVLSQRTDDEVEYIVVDGGSDDGTVDVLKGFEPRFTGRRTFRWISERDRGMYDAINKGVALATGDVIGILNADDRFEDGRVLADVADAFRADAELACVYGDIRFVRGDGDRTARYYSSRPWRPWMHYWGYMPAHPTVYVRRDVFDRFGGYRLGYDISADFEWMVRILCRARVSARYLPRCFVVMTLGGKSTAGLGAMLRLNRENVRANRENGYFCCLPMMLPKYAYKALGYLFRSGRRP